MVKQILRLSIIGRTVKKKKNFSYIRKRVGKKISGRKEKFVTHVSKEVLIKSVL